MKKIVIALCVFFTGLSILPVYGGIWIAKEKTYSGLFDVYEENRNIGTGNYITADFLLLSYSMLRKRDIHLVEQETIMPAFTALVDEIIKDLGTKDDITSKANRDFMAVVKALLTGNKKISGAGDPKRAAQELKLVLAAKGLSKSPLWGYTLDYSQFKPRGLYTRTPEQSRYFQAMRVASMVLFAVKESKATGIDAKLADRLTAQALQLAANIKNNQASLQAYTTINRQLAFRMGAPDDLVLDDLLAVAGNQEKNTAEIRGQLFALAAKEGKKPVILANIVDRNKLEKGVTGEDVLTGWRFFPQRYAPDSAFFQKLVSPESGDFTGSGKPFGLTSINGKPAKGFVSAYELMASLGSSAAAQWLDKQGEKKFSGYDKVTIEGQKELAGATGLDALHLSLLADLYAAPVENPETRLTSGLAFWTWQRYVNLLYTKQSMTMIGKGVSLDSERKDAAIEPASTLYKNLLLISYECAAHSGAKNATLWQDFSNILKRCVDISTKIRLHFPLTGEDIQFLNNLDKKLETLVGGKDHPIVVDIHTEPNSRLVVEEAIGLPVVVTQDKTRGARMSHFEFKHPMKDRLTDEKWLEMAKRGDDRNAR